MLLTQITLHRFQQLTLVYSLFQKTLLPENIADEVIELSKEETDFSRSRCPLCQWHPTASSTWMCGDCAAPEYFFGGCYTSWNTFKTRGICPGCNHRWRWTSCLRCYEWSRHEDWYVTESH